jgi:hypothetical protein
LSLGTIERRIAGLFAAARARVTGQLRAKEDQSNAENRRWWGA